MDHNFKKSRVCNSLLFLSFGLVVFFIGCDNRPKTYTPKMSDEEIQALMEEGRRGAGAEGRPAPQDQEENEVQVEPVARDSEETDLGVHQAEAGDSENSEIQEHN